VIGPLEPTDPITELPAIRRAYAKQIMASVRAQNPELQAAFATVPRERYLGPGPWQIFRYSRAYVPSPSDDAAFLYTDDVIALVPERKINNGQPSLHAYLMAAAAPQKGDHVVHIGTGSGYYTALLAEMVGPTGKVTGIEVDPQLAQWARTNLAIYPHVRIVEGDGASVPFDTANVIYVNAGATAPALPWLDNLAEGGRLILPLTTNANFPVVDVAKMSLQGAVFRLQKDGLHDYQAKWLSPIAIFPCAGNRDPASEQALAEAFQRASPQKVTKLYRNKPVAAENSWLRGEGWNFAYS
jgi:protein-L-isoaspartate(D-aspartate) O-methyltransferase